MAEYCPRCGRGSWACGCFISFAEKVRSVQAKTTDSPEPPRAEVKVAPKEPATLEEVLAGDERKATLLEYRDRHPPKFVDPMPRDDMTKGW